MNITQTSHPMHPCATQHAQLWVPFPASAEARLGATQLGTLDSVPPTRLEHPDTCTSNHVVNRASEMKAYRQHCNNYTPKQCWLLSWLMLTQLCCKLTSHSCWSAGHKAIDSVPQDRSVEACLLPHFPTCIRQTVTNQTNNQTACMHQQNR